MKSRHRRPVFLAQILAIPFLASTPSAHCQEPGKIVDQYVKATGGGKALAKIQTLTLEGTFTGDDGKAGTYTLDTKPANPEYSARPVGAKKVIEASKRRLDSHQNAAGDLGTSV